MQADLLIVQACEFLDDGDGVYRFHAPSRGLSRLDGVCVIDVDLRHRFFPQLVAQADVLIQAGFNADLVPQLERRRAEGKITVYEANDFYYDIQSWNPLAARWYDRGIAGSFRQGLTLSDAVQASTSELARRWRERTPRPIAAFPNQLTEVPPLQQSPTRPLTIGWGGSPGHFADWYHLAPRLQDWLQRHPDVHLAVMNSEFAKNFLQLDPARYHYRPFGSLSDYLTFLSGLDIGLAPLLPSDYNRCRSDVKFLEYASRGVAGIYANLEPYRESVVHGETGLLYGNEDQLFASLDQLVADPALRQRIRGQAHAYVTEHRRLERHICTRLDFYHELLPQRSRGTTISDEVLAAATHDGRYLQLRIQEPEQKLAALGKGPSSKESARNLQQIVERYPRYLAALQTLGQQLNDVREHTLALSYLERARQLEPQSARTLAEIARAHYRLGDERGARDLLEQTLTLNPHFVPAWQYLLRLLCVMKVSDGEPWAARAREFHPEHYALALLGVPLSPALTAVKLLRQIIEEHAANLSPEEVSAAATAFSETIRDRIGPVLETPEALDLLAFACRTFPHSARLANLHASALSLAGNRDESYREFERALMLRRSAQAFRNEYPQEDGIFYYGQFAEHIRAVLP